jgi:hypothetical protein
MFAAGAAIGSAVTWKIVKTKYDQIVQEELDSIREVFGEKDSEDQEQTDEHDDEDGRKVKTKQINWSELEDLNEEDDKSDDLKEYGALVSNYTSEEGGSTILAKEPYVISPYDFGELDDFHQIELTYYADDILEDDEGNIVKDVEELIGPKALYTFGEYEDDAVFVRNERLRTDFQILKDYRTFADARSIGPNRV